MSMTEPTEDRQYLVIFEDGAISHHAGAEPPEGAIDGCDNGVCDLIDITDPTKPLAYMLEGWTDV